jgi:hypothetical protein
MIIMKTPSFWLATIILLIASNCFAIPTIDKEQLKAAATLADKERQQEAYAKNPFAKDVEKYCLTMAGFRLGKAYKVSITDRRIPENGQLIGNYTIVGNAEGLPKLSFLCKTEVSNNKKIQLLEFQLYEVVHQEEKEATK